MIISYLDLAQGKSDRLLENASVLYQSVAEEELKWRLVTRVLDLLLIDGIFWGSGLQPQPRRIWCSHALNTYLDFPQVGQVFLKTALA